MKFVISSRGKKRKWNRPRKIPSFSLLLLLLSSLPLFRFDFRSSASGKLIRPFLFRGNERVGGSISRLDIDSGFLESRNTNEKRERGTCDERVFRGSCSHVKYLSEDSKIRQTTRWNKRRRNLFLSLPRFFRKAVQRPKIPRANTRFFYRARFRLKRIRQSSNFLSFEREREKKTEIGKATDR